MICCFGELLLRFSPQLPDQWLQAANMPVFLGGAELNVATALSSWQLPVRYGSVLPVNAVADSVLATVDQRGIDTSRVLRGGKRIGTYYVPQGADLKSSGVIYDRAYSAFSELKPATIDWAKLLDGVSWLHVSAISPTLNEFVAATCVELLTAANSRGITCSIDLNYRASLWQEGRRPTSVMPALVAQCQVVMGNVWAVQAMLGIRVAADIDERGTYLPQAIETAEALQHRFPNCRTMANTFRFDTPGGGIRYFATLHDREQTTVSPEFRLDSVVDRVGSGDCFMAGLIYGLSHNWQSQEVINFAASAAIGKLQEQGDATRQTLADVTNRLQTTAFQS